MIRELLRDIFAKVPKSVKITNITDNNDNTYNIYCDTSRMQSYKVANISETPNFDGDYKILSVSADYFVISKVSGAAIIELGNAKNYVNALIASYKEVKSDSIENGYIDVSLAKQMPLLLVMTDITEQIENGVYEPDLTIYIINDIDRSEPPESRETTRMPYLRTIESDLITAIKRDEHTINTRDYERQELLYDAAMDKQQNELTQYIDAIRIVPNFNFIKC